MTTPRAVMVVEAARPAGWARWRFLAMFLLLRLAGRVYGCRVEFVRPEEWWDHG